jgi:hypothetical protein
MDMMKKTENMYYINLTERYGHDEEDRKFQCQNKGTLICLMVKNS